MSKTEIKPLRLTIQELGILANCSTSKLWDVTNVASPRFDPTAPLRIKIGGSTRFDTEQCVAWVKAPALDQESNRAAGSK